MEFEQLIARRQGKMVGFARGLAIIIACSLFHKLLHSYNPLPHSW